jgi:hypothetical protein
MTLGIKARELFANKSNITFSPDKRHILLKHQVVHMTFGLRAKDKDVNRMPPILLVIFIVVLVMNN